MPRKTPKETHEAYAYRLVREYNQATFGTDDGLKISIKTNVDRCLKEVTLSFGQSSRMYELSFATWFQCHASTRAALRYWLQNFADDFILREREPYIVYEDEYGVIIYDPEEGGDELE